MVHDTRTTGVGQKFRPVAEKSTRGDFVKKSYHSLPRVLHLQHRRAPGAQLLDHDAEELLGNVDGQLLIRLEPLAVRTLARNHSRSRNLKLVTLAPHRLHQNREMELAATRHGPRVAGFGGFHP